MSRVGAGSVSAVDPSASFAAAARERLPGADIRQAAAGQLPFPDGTFGATLAQLVVHFMADPMQGLREMRRVTRPGGTVAACVWDHAGDRGPLAAFWSAVRELDPANPGESDLTGVREGQLASVFTQAGLGSTRVANADCPRLPRQLRRLVAAVHARRRPGRSLRDRAGPRPPGSAPRAMPAPAAHRRHSDHRRRLGGPRPGVSLRRRGAESTTRPAGPAWPGRCCI